MCLGKTTNIIWSDTSASNLRNCVFISIQLFQVFLYWFILLHYVTIIFCLQYTLVPLEIYWHKDTLTILKWKTRESTHKKELQINLIKIFKIMFINMHCELIIETFVVFSKNYLCCIIVHIISFNFLTLKYIYNILYYFDHDNGTNV